MKVWCTRDFNGLVWERNPNGSRPQRKSNRNHCGKLRSDRDIDKSDTVAFQLPDLQQMNINPAAKGVRGKKHSYISNCVILGPAQLEPGIQSCELSTLDSGLASRTGMTKWDVIGKYLHPSSLCSSQGSIPRNAPQPLRHGSSLWALPNRG